MATPLDSSLLQHFEVLFPFLFIMVMSYAILSYVKIFDNKAIQAFLSFLLAISMLFSPIAREIIKDAGYPIVEVDVSEFQKLDGGLSCLSLRF